MKLKLTIAMLVSVILASCTQKEEIIVSDYNSLIAKIESSSATKVGFSSSNADFFWTKGDAIGVTTTSTSTFLQMSLQGDGGQSSGTFTGSLSGAASGYAVYPFGEIGRHSLSGTTLTYNLPAEYTYNSVDAEYAKSDGNSHNAPMWGAIENGKVAFKHLGSVFAVQVNNLPANTSNLKLILTATSKINGSFTTDLSATEPVIATETTNVDSEKKVTVNFSTADAQTTGHFYIPLPTGNIGNLVLTVTDAQSNLLAMGAWDNKTVTRRLIARATVGQQSIVGAEGEVKAVSNVAEINDAVLSSGEDELIVNVSTLSGTGNISIPSTLNTETTTFSFGSVEAGAAITIGNATGADYTGKVIIEIPVGATLPSVTATIPNGEVYIKQGTVTTLVVSSANNTTIIGEGVTVETLTVNKGNVRILNGGTVNSIARGSENTDEKTYVIFEGALPAVSNTDSKIVYISAAEWDLLKKIEKAESGSTITLTENVTLTNRIMIDKKITIDLGGFTIDNPNTNSGGQCLVFLGMDECDLTIKGSGNVKASGTAAHTMAVWAYAGTINIEGGNFSNVGPDNGSELIYASNTGKVKISGGTFQTGKQCAGISNQYAALNLLDSSRKTCSIEVTGGKFYKFDPANNLSEGANTNFVATGYSSVANGDWYEVTNASN